jgi:hypothetical protein
MVVEKKIDSNSIYQWKSWLNGGWRGYRDWIQYISQQVD